MEFKLEAMILTLLLVKSIDLTCIISITTAMPGAYNALSPNDEHQMVRVTGFNPWQSSTNSSQQTTSRTTTTTTKKLATTVKVITREKTTTVKTTTTTKLTTRTSL
jgi:hypothetical protein